MVRWQVQDQAWREGSHGGNEAVMSKRLVWRCFGGGCSTGKVQLCTKFMYYIDYFIGAREAHSCHIWRAWHSGGAKETILSLY